MTPVPGTTITYMAGRYVSAEGFVVALTAAELAALRPFIRAMRSSLLVLLKPLGERILAQRKEIEHLRSPGFGCGPDETDFEKIRRAEGVLADLRVRYDTLDQEAWGIIVKAFGKELIDHAIEEGEERIGRLPYVTEESNL